MAMSKAQQSHALTTYFKNAAVANGGSGTINRNTAKWVWDSLLMDYTYEQAKDLIDYYVKHYERPNFKFFTNNYEKVDEAKQEHEQKRVERARIAAETKARADAWRDRWKQQK